MLTENKTGKYFKYAFGEIVLVVIGILIALQINNWNNQRLTNKQMNSFLQGIKDDLKSDEIAFDQIIKQFKREAEQKRNFLKLSNFEDFDVDSLFMLIQPNYRPYEINATTFDKMKSTGITQISNNNELSKNIYNYYNAISVDLKGFMDDDMYKAKLAGNYFDYGTNSFEFNLKYYSNPEESTNDLLNFQDESTRKQNLIKLLSDPTGRNHIKNTYIMKRDGAGFIARHLKANTESLITDIEKELNKK